MNFNQRENVTEDLQYNIESKEIFESCYFACRKMINLFEYFENDIRDNDWNYITHKVYCYISAV